MSVRQIYNSSLKGPRDELVFTLSQINRICIKQTDIVNQSLAYEPKVQICLLQVWCVPTEAESAYKTGIRIT